MSDTFAPGGLRLRWNAVCLSLHKMMHFEIKVDDVDAAVSHAVASGARVAADQPENRDPDKLRVMLDPAGHPFCLWSE